MAIAFVLDEDIRGPLWRAILDHNSQGIQPIDATRVGDLLDLPLATRDPDLLIWAENAQRIIVTFDRNTCPVISQIILRLATERPEYSSSARALRFQRFWVFWWPRPTPANRSSGRIAFNSYRDNVKEIWVTAYSEP